MLGARDLGLSVAWKFEFLDPGTTVSVQPGTVFADLGNKFESGVIDHHAGTSGCHSTASAIAANPHFVINHLLGPVLDQQIRGSLPSGHHVTFVFATHTDPDWDGLCSLYLCRHLVEHGSLPANAITRALTHSVDVVDQGMAQVAGDVSRAFLVYQVLKDRGEADSAIARWSEALLQGLGLLDLVLSADMSTEDVRANPLLEPIGLLQDSFADEIAWARADYDLFKEDLRRREVFEATFQTTGDELRSAKVFAFTEEPSCHFAKYWVREHEADCEVLVVPRFWDDRKTEPRVIISVPPRSELRLSRLGFALEQAETRKRLAAEDESLIRGGPPRWGDKEYSDNSDPWYDGRGHYATIIDSPSSKVGGTQLSYTDVKSVMQSRFASVNLTRSRAVLLIHSDPIPLRTLDPLAESPSRRPFGDVATLSPHFRKMKFPCLDVSVAGLSAKLYVCEPSRHVVLKVELSQEQCPASLEDWPVFIATLRACSALGPVTTKLRDLGVNRWMRYDLPLIVCGFRLDTACHNPARLTHLLQEIASGSGVEAILDHDTRCRTQHGLWFVFGVPVSIYLFEADEKVALIEALSLYTALQRSAFASFAMRACMAFGFPSWNSSDLGQGRRLVTARAHPRSHRRHRKASLPVAGHQEVLSIQADFTHFMGRYRVRTASGDVNTQVVAGSIAEAYEIRSHEEAAQQDWDRLRELACDEADEEKLRRGRFVTAVLTFVAILALGEFIAQEISICRAGELYTWDSFLGRDVYWSAALLAVACVAAWWTYREKTLAARIDTLRGDKKKDKVALESLHAP